MRKISTLLLLLISMPLIASDFYGVFEQQPPSFEATSKEIQIKAREKFEQNKITIKVNDKSLRVFMFNDKVWDMPYKMEGKTLVSKNDEGIYWVLYIENKNSIQSTNIQFKRVAGVQP